MQQERIRKQHRSTKTTTATEEEPQPAGQHSVEDIDELLDEIDTVLEENAWVDKYVQKGGE